jgi:hypothetical protein
MNSHDGAVCGSIGEAKALLLPERCCAIEANCAGALVGGISGEDARVVPENNEGTSELGDATFGTCSQSLIEIEGRLPPAEKLPRSRSSAVKDAGTVVSRFRCGGGVCQSNEVGVDAPIIVESRDSMPCMGAFTCAANCASKWCIRPSRASRCSLCMVNVGSTRQSQN